MIDNRFGEHVHVMDHPLVAHKLSILRDKNTSVKDFRELVSEIGMLITYEATRDLPLTIKTVETPLCKAELPTLAGKKIAVVPILRAGLGLVDGVLRMGPAARVGPSAAARRVAGGPARSSSVRAARSVWLPVAMTRFQACPPKCCQSAPRVTACLLKKREV